MSGTIGGGTAMAQLYELGRGRHWMAITTALVRLADYLHSHCAPIDYERRRQLEYDDLLPECDWRRICRATGAFPGSGTKSDAARCYLFETISGMPARKAPHFKGSKQHGQFGQQVMDFPLALTPELAECLRDVCCEFLAAHVSMNRLAGIRCYTSWTKSAYSQQSSMELTSEDFISSPAGCGVPSRHRDRSGSQSRDQ